MRKIFLITLSAIFAAAAFAEEPKNVKLIRQGEYMTVEMDVDLTRDMVSANEAYILTPVIRKDGHEQAFRSIGLYSRGQFYYYTRNTREGSVTGEDEMTFRRRDLPQTVQYSGMVPYQEWMDGAHVTLERSSYGCCGRYASLGYTPLGTYEEPAIPAGMPFFFRPDYAFVHPQGENVKTRSISGQAYVDFRVSQSDIDPSYHSNAVELNRIAATIDSVRVNPDYSIRRITLTGYASPDGPFDKNQTLAEARTEAIRAHVAGLYDMPASLYTVSSVAENWGGFREYMVHSNLPNRDAIIKLIDSDEPNLDRKEWLIKSRYPKDYATIREECYPYLRRTDYMVDYDVRNYSETSEILDALRKHPENLSLEEFYLAAQQYAPGSKEFNDIFAMALKYYPNDPVANLNAANIEMEAKQFDAAAAHLAKAGDSREAEYARGTLAALQKDWDTADKHFRAASEAGFVKADAALKQLSERKDSSSQQADNI